jgi:hypothetical protein
MQTTIHVKTKARRHAAKEIAGKPPVAVKARKVGVASYPKMSSPPERLAELMGNLARLNTLKLDELQIAVQKAWEKRAWPQRDTLAGIDNLRNAIFGLQTTTSSSGPAALQGTASRGARPMANLSEQVVKKGEAVSPGEFIERMSWSRQALSKALNSNRVFFLSHQNERYYPAFFFDERYERKHLESVSKELGDTPGVSKWLFFTSPKASLGGVSPLAALERGQLNDVLNSAHAYLDR